MIVFILGLLLLSWLLFNSYKCGWKAGYLEGEQEGSGRYRSNTKQNADWAWKHRNEEWGK